MSEYRQFSNDKRKARKPHRCIWCGEAIHVGAVYLDERSVYDGNIQRHRWHPECQEYANREVFGMGETEFDPYDNHRPEAQSF